MKKFLLVLILSVPCLADDALDLAKVFEEVDKRAGEVKDVKADFTQSKKMKLRKRPIERAGTIHVKKTEKGPRVCWESSLLDPETKAKSDPQRLLLLGDESLMWDYRLEDKAAEKTDLGKGRFEVSEVLTIGGSLSGLKKSFDITLAGRPEEGKGWRLALVPTSARLRQVIKSLEIEVDPKEWIVSRIVYVDSGDSTTEIRLSNFIINKGVDESLFTIPEGTKITEVQIK